MSTTYVPVTPFPDALRNWRGKTLFDVPVDAAPCGYLAGPVDENRVLADLFGRLVALDTYTERMTLLMATIERHKRYVRLYEGTVRGERNPRMVGAGASREAWSRIRPIEAMIDAMETWRDELVEDWTANIGVQFIDEAARRAS